jgi:transcriptional regulator with XRE-family HTH domain
VALALGAWAGHYVYMAKRVDNDSYSVGKAQSAEIAARLREARRLRNQSQLSLARKIEEGQKAGKLPPGVLLQNVISDLENGKRNFQGWQITLLSLALEVTEAELRDGPLRIGGAAAPAEGALGDAEIRRLIRFQPDPVSAALERVLLESAGQIEEAVAECLLKSAARPAGGLTYDEEYWRELRRFFERQVARQRGKAHGQPAPR